MAQHASVPLLLRAAEQLGDAWWAPHMLPLLLDQKSAAAVALSCKQLRRLCQGGQQSLRLDSSALQECAAVARLPAHFPACKQLTVMPRDSDELAFHLPDALAALTGMTSLSTLVFNELTADTADPKAMALAMHGVQRLLAAAQLAQAAAPAPAAPAAPAASPESVVGRSFGLQFKLHEFDGVDWHGHPRVCQAIGRLQGLNSLQFVTEYAGVLMLPSSIAHVSALAGLASTLRTLLIAPSVGQPQHNQVVDYSALGSLSRLTSLELPLAAERQGLSSISSCCQLQRLNLHCREEAGAAQQVTLQPNEMSAFSRLTQLTQLSLEGTVCEDSSGWSFLSSLCQLQQLHVDPVLPYTAVAALAHLMCLSRLTCGWEQQEGQQQVAARCPAVRALCALNGAPPLCAFPGLTSLKQDMPWEPAVSSSAAQCRTQLQELQMGRYFGGGVLYESGSLVMSAPAAARTAAVSSFAALQCLQQAVLSVNDKAEVAAVSTLRQVRRLYLVQRAAAVCMD